MKNQNRTLHLRMRFCQTLGLAVIILIVFLALMEILARTKTIQTILPTPSIGSGHKNLDVKLDGLRKLVEKEGPVDCIFIGSSMVLRGIDPEIFQQAFQEKTGQKIQCYNFGFAALNPGVAKMVVSVLNDIYHPRLIVWGTMPTEFHKDISPSVTRKVMLNPWFQYRSTGVFSLDGWLLDHSFAFRYYLRLMYGLKHSKLAARLVHQEKRVNSRGFYCADERKKRPLKDRLRDIKRRLPDLRPDPESYAAMESICNLRPETDIVIYENPVHPVYLTIYGGSPEEYHRTSNEIGEKIKQLGVLFIPRIQPGHIPKDGWGNSYHLNFIGAQVFSRWLGEKIGDAVNQGQLRNPAGEKPSYEPSKNKAAHNRK